MAELSDVAAAEPRGKLNAAAKAARIRSGLLALGSVLLVWILWGATAIPDVNEAHYFAKARQFWNPQWLPRDGFLVSGSAHWLFYAICGWPTRFCTLESTAWLVRGLCWCGLAAGWVRLMRALHWTLGQSLAAAIVFAVASSAGNFSGEWVVGGAEAKVPAYAAVLWGLAAAAESRWGSVWLWLGFATAWHPLVGGWSFLVLLGIRWGRMPSSPWTAAEGYRLIGGALFGFFLGVFPALVMDRGVDAATRQLAYAIYVRQRLSHHLVVWDFPVWHAVRFAGLLLIWREWTRCGEERPGRWVVDRFAWGALVLVGVGLLVSAPWIPESFSNFWLRYYWYRLADFAIPLAAAVAIADGLPRRTPAAIRPSGPLGTLPSLAAGLVVAVAGVWVAGRAAQHVLYPVAGADLQALPVYLDDPEKTAATRRNWHRVCEWVRTNTPPDALCLTPRYQQTFRWLAHRAEYVNWKDVPQNARSLVIWASRLNEVYGQEWTLSSPFGTEPGQVARLAAAEGIDYLVAEQRDYDAYLAAGWLAGWQLVYPSDPTQQTTYVVLRASPQTGDLSPVEGQ